MRTLVMDLKRPQHASPIRPESTWDPHALSRTCSPGVVVFPKSACPPPPFTALPTLSLPTLPQHVPTPSPPPFPQIIAKNLNEWREAAITQRLSLPRLVDVDWRVDVKLASDQVSRMSVPTTIVDLQIEQQPEKVGEMPVVRDVSFELSKEALETMLEGLGKIRDQLSSIQGASQ